MKRRLLVLPLVFVLLLSACSLAISKVITQVATIDSLLAGVYDGHMTLRELRRYGNFGIGTFEGLDGEMLLVDGRFYKVRADGRVYNPPLDEKTPFATVSEFSPSLYARVDGPTELPGIEKMIDSLVPEQNRFCTFRLDGSFSRMLVRSVPRQDKPYPALAEVTKHQPVFELKDTKGTVIGFRSPAFVKGINVPGYHMHFLTENKEAGGHVLSFEIDEGRLELDTRHEWLKVFLPLESSSFDSADLELDRSKELYQVEKQK